MAGPAVQGHTAYTPLSPKSTPKGAPYAYSHMSFTSGAGMSAGSIPAHPTVDTSLGEHRELGTDYYDGPYAYSPDLDDPAAYIHVPGAFAAYESPLDEEEGGGQGFAYPDVHRHMRVDSGDGEGFFGRRGHEDEHRRDNRDFTGFADDDGNDDARSDAGSTSSSSELSMHSALEDLEEREGTHWETAQPNDGQAYIEAQVSHGAYIHSPSPISVHAYTHVNAGDKPAAPQNSSSNNQSSAFDINELVDARELHNAIMQHHSLLQSQPQARIAASTAHAPQHDLPRSAYANEATRRAALEPHGEVLTAKESQAKAGNADADLRTAVDRMLLDQAQRERGTDGKLGHEGRAKMPVDVDANAVAGARAVLGKLGLEDGGETTSASGTVATGRNPSLSRRDRSADTGKDSGNGSSVREVQNPRQDKEHRKWGWPFSISSSGKEKNRSQSADASRTPKLRSKSQRRSESNKRDPNSHGRSQSVALPQTISSAPVPLQTSPTPLPPHVHLYAAQPWLRGGITRSNDPLENISSDPITLADAPATEFERTYEHASAAAGMRAARDAARVGCPGWDWALAGEDDDGNVWASEGSGARMVRDAWIKKERENDSFRGGQEADMKAEEEGPSQHADVNLDSEVLRKRVDGDRSGDADANITESEGRIPGTGVQTPVDLRNEKEQPQNSARSVVPADHPATKKTKMDKTTLSSPLSASGVPQPAAVGTSRRSSISPWRGFYGSRRSSSSQPPDADMTPMVSDKVQAHRKWVWGRRGSVSTSSVMVGGAGTRGSTISLPVGSTAAAVPLSSPVNIVVNAGANLNAAASETVTPAPEVVVAHEDAETVTANGTPTNARERSRSRGRVHARKSNTQNAGGTRRHATLVKAPPGERGRRPVRASSTPASGDAIVPAMTMESTNANGQSERPQPVERQKSTKAKEERALEKDRARQAKEERDRLARESKGKEQREKAERERLERETREREAVEAKERERMTKEHEREEKERLKVEAKLAKEVRERERREAKEREARDKQRAKEEAKANAKDKEKAKTKEQSKPKSKTTVKQQSVENATVSAIAAAAAAASAKPVPTPEAQDRHTHTEPESTPTATPIQNVPITTTYVSVALEDRNNEVPPATVNVSDRSAQTQTEGAATVLASEPYSVSGETRSKEGRPHKPTPAPPQKPPTRPQPNPPPQPTPGRRPTHQRRASEPLNTYEHASVPPPPLHQPASAPATTALYHSRSRSQATRTTIAGTSTATITQNAEYSYAFIGNANVVGSDPPFSPNDPPQNWVSLHIVHKQQTQTTSRLRVASLFRTTPEPEIHRKSYTIDPSMEYKEGLMDVFDRLRATPGSSASSAVAGGVATAAAGPAAVVAGLYPGMRPAGAGGSGMGKKNLTLEVEGGGMDVDVYVLPWVPKKRGKGRNNGNAMASRRSTMRRASTAAATTIVPTPSPLIPSSAPPTNTAQAHPGSRRAHSEDGGGRPLVPYQNHANEVRPDHRSWGLGLAGGNIGMVDGRRTTFERSGLSEESWVRAGNPRPVPLSSSAPPPTASATAGSGGIIPRTRAVSVDGAAYTPSSPLARGGIVYTDDDPDEKEVQDEPEREPELDAPPRLADDPAASVSDITAVDAPSASLNPASNTEEDKDAVVEVELRLKEARMGRGRKGDKGGAIKDGPEAGLVARIHAPFPRPPIRLVFATVDSIPFTPPAQPSTGHPPPAPGTAPIARPPRRPVDVPHTRTRSRAPLTLALPRTFVGPVIVHVGDGYVRDDGASGVGAQISVSRGLQAYGASVQVERGYMRGYNIGPTEKLVARSSATAALQSNQPRPRRRRRVLQNDGSRSGDTTQSDTDDAEYMSTSGVDADRSTDEFELIDGDELEEPLPAETKGWTGDSADIYVACGPVRLQLIGEDETEAWGTPAQRWYWPWGR